MKKKTTNSLEKAHHTDRYGVFCETCHELANRDLMKKKTENSPYIRGICAPWAQGMSSQSIVKMWERFKTLSQDKYKTSTQRGAKTGAKRGGGSLGNAR